MKLIRSPARRSLRRSPAAARPSLPDAAAKGTGTVGSLTNATTLSSLGISTSDVLSFNDGTNTTSYTVPGGATIGNLITAINGGTAAITASLSGGNLVLTGNNDIASITVSGTGTDAANLGFGAGLNSFQPTNLLTQSEVAQGQTLTVTVPATGGTTETLTFGTGVGQVATLGQLQTTLVGLGTTSGLFSATVNTSNGDISLTATNPNDSMQVGGTASAAKFGIQNLTALPATGTVAAADNSTFNC